ncbi:TetR family transcriptional regulator [Streptomyces sp. NBC_01478]|uniref:ScbR family autoregulator-binding transcription factor n=1 Tax=Streptomyces sp. NBC_01478 TaxID=2903882 RepID=UPI002E337E6D|nr:ScbR family autoregulator-binding transcription factor [Streptomyces sp. NBC_01478]
MVKQERAARTREALVRSAAESFAGQGFATASLAVISAGAGVSSGALHFHFAGKAELADAVEESAADTLRVLTGRVAGEEAGPLQHLIDVTHRLAGRLREDVVLRAGFRLGGDMTRVPCADLRALWQGWVGEAVHLAGRGGELRRGVAPAGVVSAVVAATVGFEVLGARDTAWLSRPVIAQFWRLLLPTLAPVALHAALDTAGTTPRP